MNLATLHLKDGPAHTICVPMPREFQQILHYLTVPADGAGKVLHLMAPKGRIVDVAGDNIASLEVAPPHVLVRDFMSEAELDQIWAFTEAHVEGFQNSGTYEPHLADTIKRRRSRILDGPENAQMATLIMPKLKALMPRLWPQLGLDPVIFNKLEAQISVHGDGDFFAIHTDNSPAEIAHREVSYVLYFHRDPKQFSGGHLRLYNTLFRQDGVACGSLAADIEPPRNGLMVFPSSISHEVTPIACASDALADQRLTLNGWLAR